ncbi:MAG: DivIVA domain-containing protein [Bacilli bacterium]|nr:DivIVA domain-containing protein [Bacilli bacterium]
MKKFSTSFKGYSKIEVNNFVKEVTKEYENMLTNLKKRDQEILSLRNELEKYKNLENTLNKAILVAEDASNNIKRVARDESNSIIEDARKNASRIVNDALLKAERVEYEAQNLKRKVIVFKRRFKQALEEQIKDIDDIDERLN